MSSNLLCRWAGVLVAMGMTACGQTTTAVGSLSAADLRKSWPLTVETLTLHCVDRSTINLEVNGVQYMLVGRQDVNNQYGWKKRTDIWATSDKAPGLKRDIGELIDVSMKKCAASGRGIG